MTLMQATEEAFRRLFAGLAQAAELRLGATHNLEDSGVLPVLVRAIEAARGV